MGPRGLLRYAMDSTLIYITYAASFLLKVRPFLCHFGALADPLP